MNCNSCAWYCHSDGRCYGNVVREELAVDVLPFDVCKDWTFDGLEDWERDALVTVEEG